MPVKATKTIFRRWFHHRTRSEYRELSACENDTDKIYVEEQVIDWTTVPGLIVEEDEAFLSVEDDTEHVVFEKRTRREPQHETISHIHDVVQRLSGDQSFETVETEEESDLPEQDQLPKRPRTIKWADSQGRDLVEQYEIEILPPLNIRIVVLMLNPAEKIFEFVQCEFSTEPKDRLTVSDLLIQLPFMASMEALKKQRYTALYRGDREMVNILSIQDYDITEGEILVAVASANNPKHSIAAAAALLLQRSLLRAVQKAKLSGRALQKLMSSADLAAVQEGSLADSNSHCEDDEDTNDESRLVLRVLNRELGGGKALSAPSTRCSPSSSSDEKDGGKQKNEPQEFPFVETPELDHDDFRMFKEATIDPYSPVARGRMAELPPALLMGDLYPFNPPFATAEDDGDIWDEISSDDEDFGDDQLARLSTSTDEDDEELAMIDEYVGMTAFSDVSETDDEEEGVMMSVALGSVASENGEFVDYDSDYLSEDVEPMNVLLEEMDSIPEIEDHAKQDNEVPVSRSSDQLSSPDKPKEEKLDTRSATMIKYHAATTPNPEESDESTCAPSKACDTPERCSEEIDFDGIWDNLDTTPPHFDENAQHKSSAFLAMVALLFGTMHKISSPRSQRVCKEPIEVDEAEV